MGIGTDESVASSDGGGVPDARVGFGEFCACRGSSARYVARVGVKRAKDCRGKLKFLARHHINNVMAERRLMELIFTLEPDMDSYGGTQVYQLNKAYVEVFDEVIREASWRGEISDATPAWLVRDIFYGGLIYALRSILLDGRKRSVDVAVDGIVNLIAPASESSDEKSLHDVADRLSRIADRLEDI